MTLLTRLLRPLFGSRPDEHAAIRPLWHRVVEIAREKAWYGKLGIADTVPGRFDAITLVLALVLLRLEAEADLAIPSVRLTELFVDDMDGQLRESGVGDLVVGKHVGRLMGVLGGRLGVLRETLAQGEDGPLAAALARNVTLRERARPEPLAAAVRVLTAQLAALAPAQLLAGDIPVRDLP